MKKLRAASAVLLLFLTALIFASSSTHADSALTIDGCRDVAGVFSFRDTFYILSIADDTYRITAVDGSGGISVTDTGVPAPCPYACFEDTFCFFTGGAADENGTVRVFTTVDIFNVRGDYSFEKKINDLRIRPDCTAAYDGSRYYVITDTQLLTYSDKMKMIGEIRLDSDAFGLCALAGGQTVCCACGDGLLVIRGGTFTKRPIYTDAVYLCGDYFSDSSSVIYDPETLTAVYSGFDPSRGTAYVSGWFVGNSGGKLTAVKDGVQAPLSDAGEDSFICSDGSRCACFRQTGDSLRAEFFTAEDIERLAENSDSTDDDDTEMTESNIPDKYVIDESDMTIRGIEPGTSVAGVVSELGEGTAVYRKGVRVRSGNVGTGALIEIPGKGSFTAVVFGDVTGEGNVNSRDLTAIEQHVMGDKSLQQPFLTAADIFPDGIIDLKDVCSVYDMIRSAERS